MFCPNCGNQLSDDAQFCPNCGTKVGDSTNPSETSESIEVDETVVSDIPTEADASTQEKVTTTSETDVKATAKAVPVAAKAVPVAAGAGGAATAAIAKKSGDKKPIVIGAIVAVVVIIAAIVIFNMFFANVKVDEKTFPDLTVRTAISNNADIDKDGELTRDEISALTELSIDGASEIQGLGVFSNLGVLRAYGSSLTSMNISDIGSLKSLTISAENLSSLDLGNKPELTSILIYDSALDSIDVTKAPKLQTIDISETPISEIDLTKNGDLESFAAYTTNLTSLDLSGNPNLTYLNVPDSVSLENLDATPLHEYWLESKFSFKYPDYYSSSGKAITETVDAYRDDDGNLTQIKTSSSDSKYTETYEYTYSDGRISGMTETSSYSSSSSKNTTTWAIKYNDSGRVESASSTGGENYRYEYNENGLISSMALTSYKSAPTITYKYNYDGNGNLTTIDETSTSTSSSNTGYAVTNDESGNITAINPNNADEYETKYSATWNADGLMTAYAQLDRMADIKEAYTYNSEGEFTNATRTTSASSTPMSRAYPSVSGAKFEYNDRGEIIKIVYDYTNSMGGSDWGVTIEYERVLTTSSSVPVGGKILDLDSPLSPTEFKNFWNPAQYARPFDLIRYGNMKNAMEALREASPTNGQ